MVRNMMNPPTSKGLLHEAMSRGGAYALKWGEKVQDAREGLGFTRNQLAQLVDTRPETIWKIEKGQRTPSDTLKCAIASALGRPIEKLFPMPSLDDINESYLSDEFHHRRTAMIAKATAA